MYNTYILSLPSRPRFFIVTPSPPNLHIVTYLPNIFVSRPSTPLYIVTRSRPRLYASFTQAHFYHTIFASIRHILFACVNARRTFFASRVYTDRVEKQACQPFSTYVATRKMRKKFPFTLLANFLRVNKALYFHVHQHYVVK